MKTKKPVAIDNAFLESLLGYNCRRAALTIIEEFFNRMAGFGFRPVDFSVLSVIAHNPGVTSRQVCATLGILSPNLVRIIQSLDERGLVARQQVVEDKRAIGLTLTPHGRKVMREAESVVRQMEIDASAALTSQERAQLIALLQKVYRQ